MARFTIDPNYSLKNLGCEVLRAARGRALGDKSQEAEAESEIRKIIAERESLDVNFVYDTDKMINIIIPDLSDKITKDTPDDDCWCCDFLYEAMGGIVVYGCGK